ncbi:MAG: triphosphoribosyl-dephospho-CoA synthase [Planctomycetaceae bacterium]|nr:triphosphoribosyl-dephospho-CoA synthase [Planctomycetaceae bacterium]
MTPWQLKLERWIQRACELEVLSPKPGNVCPGHDFEDASADDFLRSAAAIAPVLASSQPTPGLSILKAVQATRKVVSHNTNLGIILLIAPLARVPEVRSLIGGISQVLEGTTVEDSMHVYEAIRLASPGGLGNAESQDVQSLPTETLTACMQLAADRDLIARQYVTGFRDVLTTGVELLKVAQQSVACQKSQVTTLALRLLSMFPDSLIQRRCGEAEAIAVQRKAQEIIDAGWPDSSAGRDLYVRFDSYLRDDGHHRNPGTTADMVAAILFAAQREGWYEIPALQPGLSER